MRNGTLRPREAMGRRLIYMARVVTSKAEPLARTTRGSSKESRLTRTISYKGKVTRAIRITILVASRS